MTLAELYRQLSQTGPQGGLQSATGAPSSYSSGYDNAVRSGKAGTSTGRIGNPLPTARIGVPQTPASGSFNSPDQRVAQGKGGNGGSNTGTVSNPMADPTAVATRLFARTRGDEHEGGAYGVRKYAAPLGYTNPTAQSRQGK